MQSLKAPSPRVITSLKHGFCGLSSSLLPRASHHKATAAAAKQQQQIMAASTSQLGRQPRSSLTTVDDYRIVSNIDASTVPEDLKKDCILFFTPDTEPLARKIAAQGEHVTLGNIRWK